MIKKVGAQLAKALLVIIVIMILITAFLAVLGQFHIDSNAPGHYYPISYIANFGVNTGDYGLYNSGLKNSPAYHNPFIELIWLTESLSLIVLPLALLFFKKWLKVRVWPWLIVALTAAVGLWVWPFWVNNYTGGPASIDPLIQSELPNLLHAELYIVLSVVVSYVGVLAYEQYKKQALK